MTTNIDDQIKTIDSVLSRYNWDKNDNQSFKRTLNEIKLKKSNKNLYLGIIGEFSSGKSTLINSLLGVNLLTMGALQGTTTVATYFEYGTLDIRIEMNNGDVLKFKKNKSQIKETFKIKSPKLSFWKKISNWIKSVFDSSYIDSDFNKIIDSVTANEKLSNIVKRVTIYHTSTILQSGVVIVDTPGIDSLNKDHTKRTIDVISNVCDLALIVIPTEKPASQNLIDFINENLSHCVNRCLYFITKVELLRSKDIELLRTNIAKRLTDGVNATNISPICAPTLLHLESINAVEESELTNKLTVEDKRQLIIKYENSVKTAFDQLSKNRALIINERLFSLITELTNRLINELEKTQIQLSKESEELKRIKKIILSEFISKYLSDNDISNEYQYSKTSVYNACEQKKSSVISFVHDYCYSASSKKEIGEVFQLTSFNTKWNDCSQECINLCYSKIWDLLSKYQQCIDNFKVEFAEHYNLEGLDFDFDINRGPIDNLLKTKITYPTYSPRNSFVRFFTSKETIRNEVINSANEMMKSWFDKLFEILGNMIYSANNQLNNNLTSAFNSFKNKFQEYISRKIAEEKAKEEFLAEKLNQIKTDLSKLKTYH